MRTQSACRHAGREKRRIDPSPDLKCHAMMQRRNLIASHHRRLAGLVATTTSRGARERERIARIQIWRVGPTRQTRTSTLTAASTCFDSPVATWTRKRPGGRSRGGRPCAWGPLHRVYVLARARARASCVERSILMLVRRPPSLCLFVGGEDSKTKTSRQRNQP